MDRRQFFGLLLLAILGPKWFNWLKARLARPKLAFQHQQQFIVNSFRGQIYISDALDVEDSPLYDTISYSSTRTSLQVAFKGRRLRVSHARTPRLRAVVV